MVKITRAPVFTGSCPALITPFTKEGAIDYDSLGKLIDNQIKRGSNAILVLGTTGEPCTMSDAEKTEIIRFAVKKTAKRVPVIAGTGSNCTEKAVNESNNAAKLGADAILCVTPYYNRCTQEGIVKYYGAIAEAVKIPVIAYNVQSRTGVNILPSTLKKLAAYKNINAIKEASGNFQQICEMLNVCSDTGINFYSGDDAFTYPTLAMGGKGIISVVANVIPQFMSKLTEEYFKGNIQKSLDMHRKLLPLAKAFFIETNPIPVKAAAEILGVCNGTLRLPLTHIEEEDEKILIAELKKFGLL